MLESIPPFEDVLLSGGKSWLADAVLYAPVRAANTLITPEEPSTLALALVGTATVAIYLAARGLRSSRRNLAATSPDKFDSAVRRRSVERTDRTPKRGAA